MADDEISARREEAERLRQLAVERLTERHGGDVVCPKCQGDEWGVGDLLRFDALVNPGEFLPVVYSVCKSCGYLEFFAAISLGVLDPRDQAADAEPEDARAEDETTTPE